MSFFENKQDTLSYKFFIVKKIFYFEKIFLQATRILFTYLLATLFSCTGLNLRSWPLEISPNTHPSESYAQGSVFFKGGVFIHVDSNILYVGNGKLEKTGRTCSHSFLYLVAFGSSRIYDAKVDGGISTIGMVEEEIFAILGGFYHRHCTVVVGEAK